MNGPVSVRSFKTSDADAVCSLWDGALPDSQPWNESRRVIRRKLCVQDDLFFIAEAGGAIIGTVLAGYDGVRGWIYSLAVAETQRRTGIGRQLLEFAERALRMRGCDKINLQVRADNSDVIAFYERCGYATENRASLGRPLIESNEVLVNHPVPEISVNDQISLTPISFDDKAAYLKYLNQTDAFQQGTRTMPYPYNEMDAESWISRVMQSEIDHDHRRDWGIRGADGELLGAVGLFGLTMGEKSEIGYWLGKPFWGRGWVTQVVNAVCDYGFEHYGLQRIFGQVFSTNPASARVLEKCGFQQEGRLRNHFYYRGGVHDVWVYGRLARDS